MWDKYKLTITTTERILGTIPKDEESYTSYVREKSRAMAGEHVGDEADEMIPTAQDIEEKGWTTFYVDEAGQPILMDYQFKGFLKEAGNVLKDNLKVKNLRSHIENTVFVFPRKTVLAEKVDGYLERPLRAMTMQGPRVSLARSDYIEAGRSYVLELHVLQGSKVTEEVLQGILSYGCLKGLGQWRNGGYGSFTYDLAKITDGLGQSKVFVDGEQIGQV